MKNYIINVLDIFSGINIIIIIAILMLELGFNQVAHNPNLYFAIHYYILGYFIVDFTFRFLFQRKKLLHLPFYLLNFFIVLPFIGKLFPSVPFLQSFYFSQIALLILVFTRYGQLNSFFKILRLNPAQTLIMGFVVFGFLGSLLLTLPISLAKGPIPFIDALFISISALCVTGLATVDIGTTFTTFGQIIILLLIQIGGLGIMTFSVLLAMFLRKKMSQAESLNLQDTYFAIGLDQTFTIVKAIFKFTLLFELVGAGCLFILWKDTFTNLPQLIFNAVFHAVSAFCNAGLTLFPDSLMQYSGHAGIILTIATLIFFGGIGFPIIVDINQHPFFTKKLRRLRLHTKLTVLVTLALLFIGTAVIFLVEYTRSLSGVPLGEKFLIAFFQSVSSRTAGFNTFDLAKFHPATLLCIIVLMFIGASPGSTGGGIKTTTFGILMLTFWHNLKNLPVVEIFGRTLNRDNIMRALSIVFISICIVSVFFFTLLLTESVDFKSLAFETVSAFGTVGYSLGVTGSLTLTGRILVIILMLVGRVGSLTIAFALSRQRQKPNYAFPEERLPVA